FWALSGSAAKYCVGMIAMVGLFCCAEAGPAKPAPTATASSAPQKRSVILLSPLGAYVSNSQTGGRSSVIYLRSFRLKPEQGESLSTQPRKACRASDRTLSGRPECLPCWDEPGV